MVPEIKISSQNPLALLLAEAIGGISLDLATPQQLRSLAQVVVAEDLLHYATAIRASAHLLAVDEDMEAFVTTHVEHLLWVEHRKAVWRSGRITSPQSVGCNLRVEGREHLDATAGFPTVLLTPMTLAFEDALWMTHSLGDGRAVALYGEDIIDDTTFAEVAAVLNLANVRLVGATPASAREVLRVLRRGGCFLTYPDFVYRGHKVQHARFFGMRYPFSSSFIALCASGGNMLLPCYLRREDNDLTIHFEPPVQLPSRDEGAVDRRWTMHLVGATVARLLEEMILCNPAQWLLLLTLVAKADQRAE
ncbi:MAG: hypothetical protein QOE77_1385 [Blastocatellia bacterium]|jgi:lauroyl/myristoyl acyltransferase|nr:hypothetical protein [Blastocatellia bacterium]